MITGEYLVLHGAKALALPTKLGQHLTLRTAGPQEHWIKWAAKDHDGSVWLESKFADRDELQKAAQNEKLAAWLWWITKYGDFFKSNVSYDFESKLDFDRQWGLGSSSTTIANLAKITKVEPSFLLEETDGGSGYDIAVAMQAHALTYKLRTANKASSKEFREVKWNPPFADSLFFAYQGNKSDTSKALGDYAQRPEPSRADIDAISSITNKVLACDSLLEFNELIAEHESIVGSVLGAKPIKQTLYHDFQGAIKSLGSWGGDFLLVTGEESYVKEYFNQKGLNTILKFQEIIKS